MVVRKGCQHKIFLFSGKWLREFQQNLEIESGGTRIYGGTSDRSSYRKLFLGFHQKGETKLVEMEGLGGKHAEPGPTSGTSKIVLGGGSPRGNKGTKCKTGTFPCFFYSEFWG